jgi:phosphoglycerate dehydrogenase-like enzyme
VSARPRVALAPEPAAFAVAAVEEGGGQVVGVDERPDALVWTAPGDYTALRPVLARAPSARWVQLPFAGVETVAAELDPDRVWACAKGVYSEPVAEHALALALAGLRRLKERSLSQTWGAQGGVTLYDAQVTVLGGGGITGALLTLLAPFRVRATVVRRSGSTEFPGAARTVSLDALHTALPGARVVFLALALTPETEHLIGARELELMDRSAWLVNVARGRHVDTDALVCALQAEAIGGAALDVTDPEPLPDTSPLWPLPNCLITPHTANPWQTAQPRLAERISANVRRFAAGEPLLGLVDLDAGY